MKKIITLVLWIFLPFILAQCGHNRYESSLRAVDKALVMADQAQADALARADSVAQKAQLTEDKKEKLNLLLESATMYQSIDLQKSFMSISEALDLARTFKCDPNDSIRALLRLASLYNTEGMMVKEANEIFEGLNPAIMNQETKPAYYILGVQINTTLAERALETSLSELYKKRASSYRDSVINLDRGNPIIMANKLIERGNLRGALNHMLSSKPDSLSRKKFGPYYHYLSTLYKQLEMPDSQVYYLSLAADDDLKHGVKEYMALTELAEIIAPFDLQRAQKYIEQSYTDAEESHASLRLKELIPVYSTIHSENDLRQRQWIMFIIIVAIAFIIISIIITFAATTLQKKNRILAVQSEELKESRNIVDESNYKLEQMNSLLEEESRRKEYYLKSFMELCLSYLNKMERYRALLGRMVTSGDIKKLTHTINSSRYVNQEISEFYSEFDKTFINLYPYYIPILNTLLKEENRYPEDSKLTTELRIYALIWIGIEASGEIAKFLRCSESTVYNYRTQMRNKAKDRSTFEEAFIAISHQKRHQ